MAEENPDREAQADRIEEATMDFVEAFLNGEASIEIKPRMEAYGLKQGFTIRLKRE